MCKLFILFLLISQTVYCQSNKVEVTRKAKKFIEDVSKIIKRNALYADSINWVQLSKETESLSFKSTDSANYELLLDFFTKKLRDAGDMHSRFLTRKAINYLRDQPQTLRPEGSYLGDGVGIIKVPYCLTFDNSKDRDFANTIRSEIKKVDNSYKVLGWIVDLRHNVGGNMWPMLAGLNALINDGAVGYFVSSQKRTPWISKNGRINFPMRKIDDYKIKNRNANIAVLIDSMTASSGEMTAISFIGASNVKVFGQPSAGLTTGNTTYHLPDGIQLYLATTCVADRKNRLYLGPIVPDVVIENNPNATFDETLETAKRWLLQKDRK